MLEFIALVYEIDNHSFRKEWDAEVFELTN